MNLLSAFQLIFLSVLISLFLKLHVHIVQYLLSTTLPCLFIIAHKVSFSFFNLILNTLFFVNFFSCSFIHLFVHILFKFEKQFSLEYQLPESNLTISAIYLTISLIYIYIYIYTYLYKHNIYKHCTIHIN